MSEQPLEELSDILVLTRRIGRFLTTFGKSEKETEHASRRGGMV